MSDLTEFRDHALARAAWAPGESRAACKDRTMFGTPKPADHANCGGHRCGCLCHQPTDRERQMWQAIADEIDGYLSPADEGPDLFGEGSESGAIPALQAGFGREVWENGGLTKAAPGGASTPLLQGPRRPSEEID